MGLKTRKVDFEWYVPRYMGNRARFEKHLRGEPGGDPEPFMLEIKVPTFADTRAMSKMMDVTGRVSDEDNATLFARQVRGVKHYEHEGRAIVSGRELIALGAEIDADIITELNAAINSMAHLSEGLLGNLESRHSSPASPSSSAGIAGDAALKV